MEKIDLTGQRFGKLTVLEQDPNPYIDPAGRRELKWICKCDCGNTTSVTGKALRYGRAKSCGCLKSLAQRSDLVGKRYGKLVVEKEDTERENRSPSGELNRFWFCRCDCGNLISVNQRSLVRGRKSGCGCEKEEKINPRSIDMTGQRFGRLTIIEPVKKERRSTRGQMWKCLCDCGKEVVVHRSELVAKKAQSCGCHGISGSKNGAPALVSKERIYTLEPIPNSRMPLQPVNLQRRNTSLPSSKNTIQSRQKRNRNRATNKKRRTGV